MAIDPHCHWCRRLTVDHYIAEIPPGGTLPDNEPTLDHLTSRLAGRRTNGTGGTVLSCYRCNRLRGEIEDWRARGKSTYGLEAELAVRAWS